MSAAVLRGGARRWLRVAVALSVLAMAVVAQAPSPPCFVFVGLHGGVFDVLSAAAPGAGVEVRYVGDEDLAAGRCRLDGVRAVLVQHLRADVRPVLGDLLAAARARDPQLRALVLSGEAPSLSAAPAHQGLLERDPELQRYYGSSRENLRRMLGYLGARYGGLSAPAEPPTTAATIAVGVYHPAHDGMLDAEAADAWLRQRPAGARPRVAVAVHSVHLELQQPAVVDALIAALERQGLCAFGVVDTSEGLGAQQDRYRELLLRLQPLAVVHTCHSTDAAELRTELGVPHLHSLFFRQQSIDAWYAGAEGLDAGSVTFQVATQELRGAIEPQIGAGTALGGGSAEAFVPIPERIDHLARRTARLVALRTTANTDKRVAIVYWDREMDRGSLLRGSATGMFLNAPRSLLAVLGRLGREGYRTDGAPTDEDDLLGRLQRSGRQVPLHAKADLDELVRTGDPVLLPVAQYREWLERYVPPTARQELEARWGPAPGEIMVWRDAQGAEFLVLPRIACGNVVLLPQPLRGEAHDNRAIHDRKTAPPHHYVATYLWLQHGFEASALVHFGTHGSELALPGKQVGLCDKDWSDVCMGDLPNVYPWIVENLGEAMVAKRRTYAVLIGHQPAPVVNQGLDDELQRLHEDLEKWAAVPDGALKQRFAFACSEAIAARRLDRDLQLESADGVFPPAALQRVDEFLHELQEQPTPTALHVLGEPPRDDQLVPHLVTCLRRAFLDRLAAAAPAHDAHERDPQLRALGERLVRAVAVDGASPAAALAAAGITAPATELVHDLQLARTLRQGYAQAGNELDALVQALSGRYVEPGPGRGPDRNPAVLPTGRNLYSLNPDEVPSRPSWELGRQLADRVVQQHLADHGRYPEKIAFALSSFATFQDFGVQESQILWLLGVEPIWDERNLVREVRVVPREELGRPRVDVFLSALSYYRDTLPSRMRLLDQAIRAVAALDEDDNQVRAGTARQFAALRARGVDAATAERLAPARLFGYAPGTAAGASYYYLVERSGDWDSRAELMATYLDSVSHVYTDGAWGEPARAAYEGALQGTDVVLRTWYDSMTSPLSNKYTWYTGGSLALAVEHVTGRRPEYTLVDVRDPDRATLVGAEAALRREYHVRLFHRGWIEGMQREGYAGADQMAVMVQNVFGWEVMRSGTVGADVWERIKSVYLDDRLGLGLREFFASTNPFAEQSIAETMLEAARKGYWQADRATLREIAERLRSSQAAHGRSGGIRDAAARLERFVGELLGEPAAAPASPEATSASASVAASADGNAPVAAAVPAREVVEGSRLEAVAAAAGDRPPRAPVPWRWLGGGLLALAFLFGLLRRPAY